MKSKIIFICSWLCVLATMAMIFAFSAQNAEKSTETSNEFIEDVLDVVLPEEEITSDVVKNFKFPVRKVAHFGIFMLLGFCLANAFQLTIKKKWYISYPSAFVAGIIYAILDEVHQKFSEGRGSSYKDVLIDSAGVIVGISVFVGFFYLYNHILIKKAKKPIT